MENEFILVGIVSGSISYSSEHLLSSLDFTKVRNKHIGSFSHINPDERSLLHWLVGCLVTLEPILGTDEIALFFRKRLAKVSWKTEKSSFRCIIRESPLILGETKKHRIYATQKEIVGGQEIFVDYKVEIELTVAPFKKEIWDQLNTIPYIKLMEIEAIRLIRAQELSRAGASSPSTSAVTTPEKEKEKDKDKGKKK